MTTQTLRILIVDDSLDDYETIVETAEMAKLGVKIEHAADAESAIALLRAAAVAQPASGEPPGRFTANAIAAPRFPYEYVVLDLNLPRMSGLQFLSRVRADESLRGMPIVVLTTTSSERERHACFEAGASAFHVKPVAYQSFRTTIDSLLNYWCGQTDWRTSAAAARGNDR